MPLLKISVPSSSKPSTPSTENPPVQTPGGSKIKLKFAGSKPNTPIVESGNVLASASIKGAKPSKKRTANDELASPAAKRVASDAAITRKPSLMLKVSSQRVPNAAATNGARIKLQKRMSSGPKLRRINVKGRIPDREPGNAYDSEDSERELDPTTEQQLVVRMQPGEDCDLLRKAISDRTIGLTAQEGGIDVTFKFLDRELRRAAITIKKNMYAAVLVDLPCIVETMKSWDKRGWWKVADISQMLLVLGRVASEDEARHMAVPARVVNERTMAYAHGLTPPMHWARKRRFRKRLSYKDTANVEEEVTKLLEDDAKYEAAGGEVNFEIVNRDSLERSPGPDDYFQQGADDAIDTIEDDGYDDAEGEEVDEMDLDDMQAMFDDHNAASTSFVASPVGFQDQSGTTIKQETSETPAETPAPGNEGEEDLFGGTADDSSDDDDDDDDDIDTFDEDAQARAAEQNLHNQEIEDLENEIRLQRQKLDATKNQILRTRQADKLKSLQEDLRMKKRVYGLADEEED